MRILLTLLFTFLFSSAAMAASGTINIQTTPVGAKYLIVGSQDMKSVKVGLSPYYDTSFPTGKYKVCFQLEGYETVWQDTIVQTSGSAWVGPVMKKSKDVPQTTCEDAASAMKELHDSRPVPMASGSISPPTGTSSYVPPADVPAQAGNPQVILIAPAPQEEQTCREILSSCKGLQRGSRERKLCLEKYYRMCPLR